MTTLAAQITATGVTAPDYPTILSSLQASYRGIYGTDVNLDPDTQDGQLLAIFAQAIYDCNQAVVSAYNSYSPNGAQGVGLSNLVKINGLTRAEPSNSQAVVRIVGQVGRVINNGLVGDNLSLGSRWTLPAIVTIPLAGFIDVTATCTELGATPAAIGTLTVILTPTQGWQTVTNLVAATTGNPVEEDATLRPRQTVSTALPSLTILEGIYAALAALAGVTQLRVYENDTDVINATGINPHAIAAVVEGGDNFQIATAIALKKSPGTGTQGSVSQIIIDSHGVAETIRFYPLTTQAIDATIAIKALPGFTSTTSQLIKDSLVSYVNGLGIGETSYTLRLVAPSNLSGEAAVEATGLSQQALDVLSKTFTVTSVTQCVHGGTPGAANLVPSFNQALVTQSANINLVVT